MTSRFARVNQWLQFARQWHVIDAYHQDANLLGRKIAYHLSGKHKPIFHDETDCGDHVVVVNTRHIAMHGFDWKHVSFHFNRRYPRSKNDLTAESIHEYDPCRVLWMYTSLALRQQVYPARSQIPRRMCLERLHLFPDKDMPDFVRANIGNQLEQVMEVPKKSTEYTEEERVNFPRLFELKEDHIVDWNAPVDIPRWDFYVKPMHLRRNFAETEATKKSGRGK